MGIQYAMTDTGTMSDGASGELSRPYRPNPTVDQQGLEFILRHEGFRDKTYLDSAGYPTIGFGHRILPGESFPNAITREQGLDLARGDLETRVQPYLGRVEVALTQNQVNALGSFVYNVGGGNFTQSTLLRELNMGNYDAVPGEVQRWTRAGGIILPGLVTRRREEAELFQR